MMKTIDAGNGLSAGRAFVVQVQAGEGGFTGRVEHVGSGRIGWFRNLDDIRTFMEETMREQKVARRTAPRTTPVIRFLSSRLGVIERLPRKKGSDRFSAGLHA